MALNYGFKIMLLAVMPNDGLLHLPGFYSQLVPHSNLETKQPLPFSRA